MTREEAVRVICNIKLYHYDDNEIIEALNMAIEALTDNKPSRTWIAKNEYRRGWHDAITRALSEVLKIHVGNEIFDMVQKETLIGLGLSMDSALGAEPYSETEVLYPEPDQPHGEWEHWGSPFTDDTIANSIVCTRCKARYVEIDGEVFNFCPNCGSDNRKKGEAEWLG